MSDTFLPIELDVESVEISNDAGEWGVTINVDGGNSLYVWLDQPDGLYDQLHQEGVLDVVDGKVVKKHE